MRRWECVGNAALGTSSCEYFKKEHGRDADGVEWSGVDVGGIHGQRGQGGRCGMVLYEVVCRGGGREEWE